MAHASICGAELHVHLIGTLTPALLGGLKAAGQDPRVDPDQLAPLVPGSGLSAFQQWMENAKPWMAASWQDYLPVIVRYADTVRQQGVRYAEVSVSPTMFPRDRDGLLTAFEAFYRQTRPRDAEDPCLEYLWVIPRWLTPDALAREAELLVLLAERALVAGVSLVGVDGPVDAQRFAPFARRIRDAGLGLSIHAGEFGNTGEVHAALDLGATRLGHGLAAFRDQTLLDRAKAQNVHFEFCLTSNLCTGAVASLVDHPLPRALDMGLPCSLNTDNPGMFGCTFTSEFTLARDRFGLSDSDLNVLRVNAWDARFRP